MGGKSWKRYILGTVVQVPHSYAHGGGIATGTAQGAISSTAFNMKTH